MSQVLALFAPPIHFTNIHPAVIDASASIAGSATK
jgi:hypothetical protein